MSHQALNCIKTLDSRLYSVIHKTVYIAIYGCPEPIVVNPKLYNNQ